MEEALDSTVLDHLPLGVLVVGSDGRILRANSAAGSYCPWPAEDATGRSVFDVLGEYRETETLESAFRGAMVSEEPMPDGFEAILDHADGKVVASVWWLAKRDGRFGVLLLHRAGASGLRGGPSIADLAQRIADVKHQINNPLMGILGHAELLMIDAAMPAEARNRAEIIQGEARRIRDQMELLDRLRQDLRS